MPWQKKIKYFISLTTESAHQVVQFIQLKFRNY